MTNAVEIIEGDWPAHFIASDACRFYLNTLVTRGHERFVVSTVGQYQSVKDGPIVPLYVDGDRYYETRIFRASWFNDYWKANVYQPVDLAGVETQISAADRNVQATAMHHYAVNQLAARLREGQHIE